MKSKCLYSVNRRGEMLKRLVEGLTGNRLAAGELPNKHLSNGKVNNQTHLPMINYTGQVNCGSECLFIEPFYFTMTVSALMIKWIPC